MAEARLARRFRNVLTLAVMTLVVGGCSPMDDLLVAVFGRSMRDQPSFDPYENPQLPPAGSVPFASGNFPSGPDQVNLGQAEGVAIPEPFTQGELVQQIPRVVNMVNPVPATAESLDRGQVLFARTCVPCHGAGGLGDGPVTQVGMLQMSILTDQARGYTDGYIYGMIRVGRGLMPSYGHQITHFDRWNLVNYVRSLQGTGTGPADGDDNE